MPKFVDSALQRLAGLEPFPQPPVIRTRYPVVLMHGFGFLAAFRRGGHLHDDALYLRRHGVLAYAPNVAPYHTVSVRAGQWSARLDRILEETRADKVNLIAHSMGGLDARFLISALGRHADVASLVTVASPHHGTTLATFVLEQPDRVRSWAADLANWMGANAMEDATADFLTAVSELTPEHVRQSFNPAVPDHPGVRYWSFAGRAGKGTDVPINPFLQFMNRLLYAREGINDGFIPVDSARWGTFLGVIDADHTQQVGLEMTLRSRFNAHAFYLDTVRMLRDEGL